MVQRQGRPAERPQVAGQHTAEEEKHLRTLTWLAYLEDQKDSSRRIKKKGEWLV